jgi:hypothetical protein
MTDSRCVIDAQGNKCWFNERGQLHRLDGPAIEWWDGLTSWWVNGHRHRLEGPAIEDDTGVRRWWVMDKKLTQEEFEQHPLVVFHRLRQGAL